MSKSLNIAIAGLGTVGAGTVRLLADHADMLSTRCGRDIRVTAVSARDKKKDRGISLGDVQWFDDPVKMATDADVDVVVELIGGADGAAKASVEAALSAGRHVVTANKALLAHHGTELARLAEGKGVSLNYEAAVAGGIPIIKAMREGLAANGINHVYGILNGTCNYILSVMRDTGRTFEDVLAEAQKLGYAEADPSFDVDGVDTAHKLAILASVAFGTEVDFDNVYMEGIRHVSPLDIRFADELGFRIKLLGLARLGAHGLEQRVHPCMVRAEEPIAHVNDAFNAVVVQGDFVDTTMFEGRGAGAGPTASAVVADIADIARGISVPTFAVPVKNLKKVAPAPEEHISGAYYVRLTVLDQPGVFADVAAALRDHEVSMESVLQHGRAPGEAVSVVMTLHVTEESKVMAALDQIGKSKAMTEPPRMIRIVSFGEGA